MAKVTITIPDEKVDLVKSALGYDEEGEVEPAEFFQGWVAQKVRRAIQVYEINKARKSASLTDTSDIE